MKVTKRIDHFPGSPYYKEGKPDKEWIRVIGFNKSQRSTFSYWFAHWCAFQLTALGLGCWKWRFLFHDWEKPWLRLWWRGNYRKVQIWHRLHRKHHLEYGFIHGWDKLDLDALVVDWHCCGLSKTEALLDARETLEYEVKTPEWKSYEDVLRKLIEPKLDKYGL